MVARSVVGVLAAAAVLGLALTGCTSAERASTTPAPTTYAGPPIGAVSAAPSASAVPGAAAPSVSPSAVPGAPGAAPAAAGKVSATTASEQEILAALTRAGVPTPERWTAEIIEYRPYPADDRNLVKLRQNLAKYNPAPGVVDKIVSVLTP